MDEFSSIGDATEGDEGIDADHNDMCKFKSRNSDGYQKVLKVIKRWIDEASMRALLGEIRSSSVLKVHLLVPAYTNSC